MTSANGCSSTGSILVMVYDLPVITGISGDFMPETAITSEYSVTANSGSVYLWEITGGSQVSGGTTNNIVVEWGNNLGTAEICVTETDTNGCTGESFCQTLEIVSDAIETNFNGNISIAPNPMVNQLNVAATMVESMILQITLFDISGKIWASQKTNSFPGVNKYEVDVTILPAGMYCLQVKSGLATYSKRIAKF